jgi:proline dehydrogenase
MVAEGLSASIGWLGPDARTAEQAVAARDEWLRLTAELSAAELTPTVDVSVALPSLGQGIDDDLAYQHAREICARATEAGTTVTLDSADSSKTDATLDLLIRLRRDFPTTGVTLAARARRTEADCRDLSAEGCRVRLCKGGFPEPESVAFQSRLEVDRSYVRCVNVLMSGDGYPMVATHDPRLIAIAEDRARWFERTPDEFEFQVLHGVRPAEARRLVASGYTVRVYVPYGPLWYPYFVRRMIEHPASAGLMMRN